jgi:hypothetical protein
MRLLYLAGFPASGKSLFGQWLESRQGFLHIDPEEDTRLEELSIDPAWQECVSQRGCDRFCAALLEIAQPVVFNWGFPVRCLPVVASLKRAGFSCWWFEADVGQSRRAFQARRKGTLQDFETQVAGIEANRPGIRAIFGKNSLTTLSRRGARLRPETIWSRMNAAA